MPRTLHAEDYDFAESFENGIERRRSIHVRLRLWLLTASADSCTYSVER
jgi:hypothetical protein